MKPSIGGQSATRFRQSYAITVPMLCDTTMCGALMCGADSASTKRRRIVCCRRTGVRPAGANSTSNR